MQSTQDDMLKAAFLDGAGAGRDAEWDLDAAFDAWKAEPEVAEDLAIIAVPVCPFCGGSGDDPWADYEVDLNSDGPPSERPAYCRVCEGERRVTTERFLSWLTEAFHEHGMACIADTMEDEGRSVLISVANGVILLGDKVPAVAEKVAPENLTPEQSVGYVAGLMAAFDLVGDMVVASDPD